MNRKSFAAQPWRALAFLTAGMLLATAACNRNPPAALSTEEKPAESEVSKKDVFTEVTAQTGINHTYKNGQWLDPNKDHYAIPESLGGGGGAADFFGTGRLDLIICGGGYFDRTHS